MLFPIHTPVSLLLLFGSVERQDSNAEISNEVNIVVLFPDKNTSDDDMGKGFFRTQDEFRKFLLENDHQRTSHVFYTRPTENRVKEYVEDEFIRCFPLQFPYGNGGFHRQTLCRQPLSSKRKDMSFQRCLKYLLRHRGAHFHTPLFNLMANGIIMRNNVFRKVKIQCNVKTDDHKKVSEEYGFMKGRDLESAITQANSRCARQKNTTGDRFLRSIRAVCEHLPHSNEATAAARSDYFSMLVAKGLPALFVTISPDDKRSLWIQVYAHRNPSKLWEGEPDLKNVDEDQLRVLYKKRCLDRLNYPGLCAEEYMALMEVFIRDVLKWDVAKQEPSGMGLFGMTEAFTLATEEQGRRTLHGHFLIWIKGWNELLNTLMFQKCTKLQLKKAMANLKRFVRNAASVRIFSDLNPGGLLHCKSIYSHGNDCRTDRREGQKRYTAKPVSKLQFEEMRGNDTCRVHLGHIGTCPKCGHKFKYEDMLTRSLQSVSGSDRYKYDHQRRHLEAHLYELQKDFWWNKRSGVRRAKRRFYVDVMCNNHSVTHDPRCFKKARLCYSYFPVEPQDQFEIQFSEEKDTVWADYLGRKMHGRIFEGRHERKLEDCYGNTNNPVLTSLFCCNNNIITTMTGKAVLYVTGYNVKKQQKEERLAFENVGQVLVETFRRQEAGEVTPTDILPSRVGFRRLMSGVFIHTNSLVIAAPMAHYLAFNGSRYRYSHDIQYIPIRAMSNFLKGGEVAVDFSPVGKDLRHPYCVSMNYLYRPKECEEMSMHSFFTSVIMAARSLMSEQEKQACTSFISPHPKSATHGCIHRKRPVVGKVDWTFFEDAKKLERSVLHLSHMNRDAPPTPEEERRCRCILLLLCPFRSEEDLKYRDSYTRKFQKLHSAGYFRETEYLLNNIQNIWNSKDSERMGRDIPTDTINPDFKDDEEDDEESMRIQNELIHTYMLNSGMVLSEEPTEFEIKDPKIPNQARDDKAHSDPGSCINDENEEPVFEFGSVKIAKDKLRILNRQRFVCDPLPLNQMLKSSFIISCETAASTAKVKATGSVESIIHFGASRKLDLDQQTAFEILTATVVSSFVEESIEKGGRSDESTICELKAELEELRSLSQYSNRSRDNDPLRMFLTGPAGAGKSTILNSLVDYCQEFCISMGHMYDEGVIRLTALTGSAATEIKGSTTHSECRLMSDRKLSLDDIKEWKNTRLLVVDEISFGGYNGFLKKLDQKLRALTEEDDIRYGSVPIVFIGDFFQLEPIDSTDTIYKSECKLYWEDQLNAFVELKGTWRYKQCEHLKRIFPQMRRKGITQEVREVFNSRVVGRGDVNMPDIVTTKIATRKNSVRESFNDRVFLDYLERNNPRGSSDCVARGAIVIKGDLSWTVTNAKLSYAERKVVFNHARESDTFVARSSGSKRVAPMLKLFKGCQVMCLENENVSCGIANGTTALLEQVLLKDGMHPHKIRVNGYYVWAVRAEEVDCVKLKWTEDSTFQGYFYLKPKSQRCKSNVKIPGKGNTTIHIGLYQVPISVNHATTGHKLQGKTVDSLLVAEWASKNVRNWIYVVLSRIRSLAQLFLLTPLPEETDEYPDSRISDMLNRLRERLKVLTETPGALRCRAAARTIFVAGD